MLRRARPARGIGRQYIQSWLRCLNDCKLDPATPQQAYIVPNSTLRAHHDQAEELIRISRSSLSTLFEQIAEPNDVLLLSDARGVAVGYLGHSPLDLELRRAGLYLGAEWSERRAGKLCGWRLSGQSLSRGHPSGRSFRPQRPYSTPSATSRQY